MNGAMPLVVHKTIQFSIAAATKASETKKKKTVEKHTKVKGAVCGFFQKKRENSIQLPIYNFQKLLANNEISKKKKPPTK